MSVPPETTVEPSEAAERVHVTRSRAKPGGTVAGSEGAVPFRRARKPPVAEGAGAGRADLPAAEGGDRRRGAAHRLRGGQLPQRRRVLGARHGDLHDPRRRLHPPLRLLQREDGGAELERPAGAAAGRQPGEADGAAPRRRHLGRPRRPARLRRRRLRRHDPLDPHAGARLQGRGAYAGLPRPGDAAGQGDRTSGPTSSTTTSRRCRGCTRRRGAAPSSCARRGCCGWRRRWAAPTSSPSPG